LPVVDRHHEVAGGSGGGGEVQFSEPAGDGCERASPPGVDRDVGCVVARQCADQDGGVGGGGQGIPDRTNGAGAVGGVVGRCRGGVGVDGVRERQLRDRRGIVEVVVWWRHVRDHVEAKGSATSKGARHHHVIGLSSGSLKRSPTRVTGHLGELPLGPGVDGHVGEVATSQGAHGDEHRRLSRKDVPHGVAGGPAVGWIVLGRLGPGGIDAVGEPRRGDRVALRMRLPVHSALGSSVDNCYRDQGVTNAAPLADLLTSADVPVTPPGA
jgi:hypothetical protein